MGALLREGVCLLVVLPLLPVKNSNSGNRGNAVRSRFGLRGLGDLAGDGEGGRAEVAGGGSQVGRHRDTPVDSAMTTTTPWLVGRQNTCTSRPCRCSVTKGHRVRGPCCASMVSAE